jgi:hypothetical protein
MAWQGKFRTEEKDTEPAHGSCVQRLFQDLVAEFWRPRIKKRRADLQFVQTVQHDPRWTLAPSARKSNSPAYPVVVLFLI